MKHEKIIKKPELSVKIEVQIRIDYHGRAFWDFTIWVRDLGKRKWHHVILRPNEYPLASIATQEEINQAKTELWQKIKP